MNRKITVNGFLLSELSIFGFIADRSQFPQTCNGTSETSTGKNVNSSAAAATGHSANKQI